MTNQPTPIPLREQHHPAAVGYIYILRRGGSPIFHSNDDESCRHRSYRNDCDAGRDCCRARGMVFFDPAEPSQIVEVVVPLFLNLNAATELVPVMNVDDLRKGLGKVSKH